MVAFARSKAGSGDGAAIPRDTHTRNAKGQIRSILVANTNEDPKFFKRPSVSVSGPMGTVPFEHVGVHFRHISRS